MVVVVIENSGFVDLGMAIRASNRLKNRSERAFITKCEGLFSPPRGARGEGVLAGEGEGAPPK